MWKEEQACGKCSSLRGIFWATQILLKGVAAFILGHRARMTSLNTDKFTHKNAHTGTYNRCRTHRQKRKGKKEKQTDTDRETWLSMHVRTMKYQTRIYTRTAGLPHNGRGVKWVQGMLHCGKAFNTCLDTSERSRTLPASWSTPLVRQVENN